MLPMISSLYPEQQRAVFRFYSRILTLVVGPPGTGKTNTAVVLLEVAVTVGEKAIVVAETNTAVRQILKRAYDKSSKGDPLYNGVIWARAGSNQP